MESITCCPICNETHFTQFLSCKDFTTSLETFSLSKCNTCQFVFTNPRPSKEEIGKYYESDKYISHSGGKKNLIDWIYLLARKRTIQSKHQIIEQNSKGKAILDFGCGTGEFLKELSNNGYKTFGVEPSLTAREKAIKLKAGNITQSLSEISAQNFDVITLWHVLEHVHDLNESLRNFHYLLKNSGTIFIAVPNLKSQDAKHYKSYWAGFDAPRHLWHFSQADMKSLLKNNGFQLQTILPMKLDAYYVSLLSESYKNPNRLKIQNYLNAFINAFKSNVKARKNMNYSSLIYIASK